MNLGRFIVKRNILACSFIILLILLIGPLDFFKHGHYFEEFDLSGVNIDEKISLEGIYHTSFVPKKNYLNGISLYIQKEDDSDGILVIDFCDSFGKEICSEKVEISSIKDRTWHKICLPQVFKKDNIYSLNMHTEDNENSPNLLCSSQNFVSSEERSDNVIMAFSYAKSTFSFQQKTIIILFFIGIGLLIMEWPNRNSELKLLGIIILMSSVLSWNYMYNFMDSNNESFSSFQADSEGLVVGVLKGKENTECFYSIKGNLIKVDNSRFGLARSMSISGQDGISYLNPFESNDIWNKGYGRSISAIRVSQNNYTESVVVQGNYVEFANGERHLITSIEDYLANPVLNICYRTAYLDTDSGFNPDICGPLSEAKFFDSQNNLLPSYSLIIYRSQYGLQGKVFNAIAFGDNLDNTINNLHLMCSFLSAMGFTLLVVFIKRKYNLLLAGCFYCVFWLSPWIVNFSRNLYWVIFTWFFPMLIGLICSLYIQNKKVRYICYILLFLSVAIKCLCGYEYVTSVMLGSVAFVLADLITLIIKKQYSDALFSLKGICGLGIAAMMGFCTALIIHGIIMGEGDYILGLKEIIVDVALKRTSGADYNEYQSIMQESFSISAWEVLLNYFHFSTDVITGVSGALFPLIAITPIGILVIKVCRKEKVIVENYILYIIFFLTTVSWLFLGKAHSFIHTNMNYVLWYFGFVQVCIYILMTFIGESIKKLFKDNGSIV